MACILGVYFMLFTVGRFGNACIVAVLEKVEGLPKDNVTNGVPGEYVKSIA